MPIIKSAQKRVRIAKKAAVRNLQTKRNMKSAIRTIEKAVKSGKKSVGSEYNEAVSAIDKAVKKGVIHKNKAARQKSRLATLLKKSGIKIAVGTKKTAPKAKAVAKKTVKPKTPAKKAVKKPAAKKTSAKAKK